MTEMQEFVLAAIGAWSTAGPGSTAAPGVDARRRRINGDLALPALCLLPLRDSCAARCQSGAQLSAVEVIPCRAASP